ncbi:GNAT family N-acetyltransferase [Paucibacter sp. Y2R2-4]|uniref:GNAT family N-acetyltransferase n=1 Tax=Paucibacter sp. Y2R2-4 TaxID=2893553 RepID=UPI0021E4250F|nr:GNAT family N-acetyltransferase [Paucibacter sp. Y2R2-4]MCV2350718.1 GNAT family N-acetyltransferase [Paucibacter sp. Y2R2-4]
MKIETTLSATEEERALLSEGIVRFNHEVVPDLEPESAEVRFFVLARNDADALVGGIRAICFWNALHIELLWLSPECRGTGLGSELLKAAEAKAKSLGMGLALVMTTSWQAKPFYEKHGYVLLSTIEDLPKGHSSHHLQKRL